MPRPKRIRYQRLVGPIDVAIEGKFFLEAVVIAFVAIEDRLESALNTLGGSPEKFVERA